MKSVNIVDQGDNTKSFDEKVCYNRVEIDH